MFHKTASLLPWLRGRGIQGPPTSGPEPWAHRGSVGTVEGVSTPDPELAAAAAPWARRSWAGAYALLALALVWVVLSWAGVVVVVGSIVVPIWAAAPALLLAGTAARMGLGVFRVQRPAPEGWWRWALPTVTAGAWVLVPLTAAANGFGGPSYVVVEPAGSGGCRAVVAESSFLFAGSGTVHVAGGWGPFAPQVGRYTTDDGFRPVSTGFFSVSWDDQFGGLLSVAGALPGGSDGEGGSGLFDFDC